jgi:5-methylcytosine-specific restriction protein A
MSDWININKDSALIAREKIRARELKKTQWWKNRIAAGECHYCHGNFRPEELTMDHVVPLSRGGRSNKGNVVACCKKCNNDKKYLTPVDIKLKELQQQREEEKTTDPPQTDSDRE